MLLLHQWVSFPHAYRRTSTSPAAEINIMAIQASVSPPDVFIFIFILFFWSYHIFPSLLIFIFSPSLCRVSYFIIFIVMAVHKQFYPTLALLNQTHIKQTLQDVHLHCNTKSRPVLNLSSSKNSLQICKANNFQTCRLRWNPVPTECLSTREFMRSCFHFALSVFLSFCQSESYLWLLYYKMSGRSHVFSVPASVITWNMIQPVHIALISFHF